MAYALYNTTLCLAAPLARIWLRRSERYQPLLGRFDPEVPPQAGQPLWVHACSVGEVKTARPLLDARRAAHQGLPLLLTTSTVSGREMAESALPQVPLTWLPFDRRSAVHDFIKRAQPRGLVLIETELWPNLVRVARQSNVPVLVVNGRVSDKHYRRYQRFKRLFRPVFTQLTHAAVQHPVFAERFISLGSAPETVTVTGNAKFDAVATSVDPRQRARLRALHDFSAEEPVLIFGSTRPGDEALAADCWKRLRAQFPRLRLVVAPRHTQRLHEVLDQFDEEVALRSELVAGRGTRGRRVLILDTTGELAIFYAVATVAVVGGSFYPGVDGHNPLEPAALGVPTVFGAYMNNFRDPAAELLKAGGAIQVPDPAALAETLARLLGDPGECRRLGTRGRGAVLENQGVATRNAALIAQHVDLES